MRKRVLGLLLLAGAVAVMSLLVAAPAGANPPGDTRDADIGKMLWKFNVLAVKNTDWSKDDLQCSDSGRRVFFDTNYGGSSGTIDWTLDPTTNGFQLTDCDGTTDGAVAATVSERVSFWVTITIHGPPTASLNLVCQDIVDFIGTDDLCVVGSTNVSRNAHTKIFWNVFENEYEEVLWTLSGTAKNAEVRLYEKL